MLLLLSGCGALDTSTGGRNKLQKEEEASTEAPQRTGDEKGNPFYLVLSNDSSSEILRVYNYTNGQTYQYRYSLTTSFLDKYGNLTSPGNVPAGKLVTIGELSPEDILQRVQVSDEVWEYTNIERFSIDEERTIFQIADKKYTWKDNLFVFSNEDVVSLSDIQPEDELTVVGVDKQILAVIITTGQGTLKFANTDLFEGSYAQIGKKIFAKVTKNMSMDIPEGTYKVAVAYNGWGGSRDVVIKRGKETTIDLDEIKGEGPSYGMILFQVDVEDAQIAVDEKLIDYSKPMKLQYGEHSLMVTAEGYDVWERKLYVNSEEATIRITLKDEEEKKETTVAEDTEEVEEEEDEEKDQDTDSSDEKENTQIERDEYLKDYLSTISSLIESMS